jgi:site-specific recombinase XerD
MADEKIIPTDPIAAVRIPRKPKTLPKIYSEQDLVAVIRAAETNVRDNTIFSLYPNTRILRFIVLHIIQSGYNYN